MTGFGDGRGDYLAALNHGLLRVLGGDPRVMASLEAATHEDLLLAARTTPTRLVVSRAAVVAVLMGFRAGSFTPSEVQAWASFVGRGYRAGARGLIHPLDIDYEAIWEDGIVEAVGRLDEIGDVVDGQVSDSEVSALLQLLDVG